MQKEKIKKNKGFVILFAVMLSGIILAITIGVLNISYKEIKFSTSAKDTNDAFFAADVGAECALFYDRADRTKNAFTGDATLNCNESDINFNISNPPSNWTFLVSRLGNENKSCAIVTVDKSNSSTTKIISKGYNDGGENDGSCTQVENTVERQLELTY